MASPRENDCVLRVVLVYNAFFWISGPGMIALGIWLYITLEKYDPVLKQEELCMPAYIIITAGLLSVLAGLIGCFGSFIENKRLLGAYFCLMLVICVMEVCSAILLFIAYDQAENNLSGYLSRTVPQLYCTDTTYAVTMNAIQNDFECCGVQSYEDYAAYASTVPSHQEEPEVTVPLSCCLGLRNGTTCRDVDSSKYILHPELFYQTGCLTPLLTWIHTIYVISGWAAAGVAATMVLALSVVGCLKLTLSLH